LYCFNERINDDDDELGSSIKKQQRILLRYDYFAGSRGISDFISACQTSATPSLMVILKIRRHICAYHIGSLSFALLIACYMCADNAETAMEVSVLEWGASLKGCIENYVMQLVSC